MFCFIFLTKTTDENWKECVLDESAKLIHKVCMVMQSEISKGGCWSHDLLNTIKIDDMVVTFMFKLTRTHEHKSLVCMKVGVGEGN